MSDECDTQTSIPGGGRISRLDQHDKSVCDAYKLALLVQCNYEGSLTALASLD